MCLLDDEAGALEEVALEVGTRVDRAASQRVVTSQAGQCELAVELREADDTVFVRRMVPIAVE